MKKTISLVCAMLMSVVLFAQDRELSMADCGGTQWGTVSVDGNVITFGGAWDCGIGWWLDGEPLTAYHRVTLTFEPFEGQIALNVQYDAKANDYKQVIGTAGGSSVSVDLDPAKSGHVDAIYLQSSKMGRLTVKKCVLEGGADPYDITGKAEVTLNQEPGENCVKIFQAELERHNPNDVVVITLNCLNAEKKEGWGIAKIVAMDDWNVSQCDLNNKCDGLGKSEYKFLISELINFAKKGTNDWYIGPDSQAAGVIVNNYAGDSEIVSVKCYAAGETAIANTEVEANKAQKVVENGVLYIIKNGVRYNALGTAVK